MKKQSLFLGVFAAICIAIVSCNQEQLQEKIVEEKLVCYQSISGSDTAWLSIDTAKSPISGKLTYNYTGKKEILDGQFKGKMYGDTLKGHFDFKINNAEPPFRNPVAFLKKDGKLTMGEGQFMTVMGSGEFDDRVPIVFENGRFVFEEINCME